MLDQLDHETLERDFLELERAGFAELAARLRHLVPPPNDAAQLQLVDSVEVLPVTDAHVRLTWNAFYRRPDALSHIPIVPPSDDWTGQEMLAALRRVLEEDRQFVAREIKRLQDPALAAGMSSTSSSTQEEEH